mgnify:CR=1 FL=1
MAAPDDLLLDVRNLRITAAAGAVLVDDVSFTLAPGEVIGLIGESGAGKSTIGLAALGHVRPGCLIAGGSICLGGREVLAASEKARRALRGREIAYVAQSAAASFNPSIRIGAQVIEAPVVAGQLGKAAGTEKAEGLFTELDLPAFGSFGRKYPHEASGGQLQRAMAAMAMIGGPRVLVFDEPTTALDVTTQVDVLAAFRRVLREFGCAAIYITHDIAVVSQMADKIIVLRGGRMVEAGPTNAILTDPKESYTRELVRTRRSDDAQGAGPDGSGEPVLSVRDVEAIYGSHKVLHGVSVDLPPRSITAVVGESGSGKSTLARCIVGLMAPSGGEIRFSGETLAGYASQRTALQLRRIQLIHQNPDMALNPRQTVLKTIARPLEVFQGLRGSRVREEVARLLAQTELPESLIDRPTSRLSGGQKQRVCIARALAAKPDLLICDEVTASLDQLVADGILDLLRKIRDTASILFISHDLGTVRRLADRLIVMKSGEIVERDTPANIFSNPRHPYTSELLSSVPEPRTDWLTEVLAERAKAEHAKIREDHR